jgi:hypothetical protein
MAALVESAGVFCTRRDASSLSAQRVMEVGSRVKPDGAGGPWCVCRNPKARVESNHPSCERIQLVGHDSSGVMFAFKVAVRR